ncbi:MAG: SPFH domain-containing protein [Planctomycetota bacterium]|nr:SPFH domain-containing protein [Planctomycetota bacterium]
MNWEFVLAAGSLNWEFVLGSAALILVGFFALVMFIKSFLLVCPPNQVMIFSGRTHVVNGKKVGYRVIFTGRAIKAPFIEEVARLDLRTMDVHLYLKNAYAKGGVPLNIEAIANIKITSNPSFIMNAIERFLGQKRDEIRNVGKETLEGHLRGVIAKLTPEQCNEDRLRLMDTLRAEAEEDLKQLGLHLDTFNIHQISDDTGYLEAIGRENISVVKAEVEVAKSNADRASKEEEAGWQAKSSVAREQAEAAIAEKQNELRRIKAEMEAQAKSEEETAESRAKAARARAEKELQQVRAQLEKLRLEADVIAPAEAENAAKVFAARGAAAPNAERGRAMAESLGFLGEVWKQAGDDAKSIFVIQRVETLLGSIVDDLDITIDEANLVDDGSGTALPQYVSSHLASVAAVLSQLRDITGLDLHEALGGNGNDTKAIAGGA